MQGFYWFPRVTRVLSESGTEWQLLTVDRTWGMRDGGAALPWPVREDQGQVCEDTSDLYAQWELQSKLPLQIIKSFRGDLKTMCIYRQTHELACLKVLILLFWLNLNIITFLVKIDYSETNTEVSLSIFILLLKLTFPQTWIQMLWLTKL